MRVEPYSVGSFVHVLKRGGRGMSIVRDDADRWRFLRSLYYLNDKYLDNNWLRSVNVNTISETSQTSLTMQDRLFFRPADWPERKVLLHIHAFVLMPNHIHLLLEEIEEGGVSLFMKRLGQSMTNHFNEKYKEKGSIFQGAYKSRTITDDSYLRHLAVYIMVKNTFELYEGGLEAVRDHFDDAWDWAMKYPFTSLADVVGDRNSPIIHKGLMAEAIGTPAQFKKHAKAVIMAGNWEENLH